MTTMNVLVQTATSLLTVHIFTVGILELIPAITFLLIMHPQLNTGDRSYSPTPDIQTRLSQSGSGVIISRVDSGIRTPELETLLSSSTSSGGGQTRRDTPLVLQHKGAMGYGTSTGGY
jgi:hypothetical protein